jgi:predicted GNAT family N-acyltransferase
VDIFNVMRRSFRLHVRSQLQPIQSADKINHNESGIEVRRAQTQEDIDACFRLRHDVFTIEQGVAAELDIDEYDKTAYHYLAVKDKTNPVGTARVIVKGSTVKIGRVAVLSQYRKLGIGGALMRFMMADHAKLGASEVVLSSQLHAAHFYSALGFLPEGEEYMEADIPHITMRCSLINFEGLI